MRRRQFKQMLEHVRVLRLEPGDVLILAYPDHITMQMAKAVKDRLQGEFPGHKAIVIDGGASFDVLRGTEHIEGQEGPWSNLPTG